MLRRLLLLALGLVCHIGVQAQVVKVGYNDNGTIGSVVFEGSACDTLKFHSTPQFDGPRLILDGAILPLQPSEDGALAGTIDDLRYSISYVPQGGDLILRVECQNTSNRELSQRLSLRMGLNTTMSHYPQWRSAYFPTLIRMESTHMWGYLMSPNGGIVTIASPDPLAAYELYYNNDSRVNSFAHGHRIASFGLDLLNSARLPERYAHGRKYTLKAGEKRVWRIVIGTTTDLQSVVEWASSKAEAPIVEANQYTIDDDQQIVLNIHSNTPPRVEIISPSGVKTKLRATVAGNRLYRVESQPHKNEQGLYSIVATAGGKRATASVNVRHAWSSYMNSARRAAVKYPQKGGSHTESWYGFFSAYKAREIAQDPLYDKLIDAKFDELYPLMHDTITNLPTTYRTRIQNSALMAALLAQKYRVQHQEGDLRRAARILDFLMTTQGADGAYRNGKVHYTSVIYIAKAFMEVMQEEKRLANNGSAEWKDNYARHFASVRLAIDDLAQNLDNIDTEGELTYEDGMISCSYTQLSMFALLMPEGSAERARYTKAAQDMARGHRALSQLLVPDARMNGGSLRYWEAQYDILTFPNMMNSPHGWSAWRIYGLKYLYELTGEDIYLRDMINALGSCVQLIDPKSDKLNWAFIVDPYLNVEQFIEDPSQPGRGVHEKRIIGEQYLPMISDWYRAADSTWVTGYWGSDGGSCDNDVHEIFKCMGEIALTSAYLHQCANGELLALNCKATRGKEGKFMVVANEDIVDVLYTNIDNIEAKNIKQIIKVKNK